MMYVKYFIHFKFSTIERHVYRIERSARIPKILSDEGKMSGSI